MIAKSLIQTQRWQNEQQTKNNTHAFRRTTSSFEMDQHIHLIHENISTSLCSTTWQYLAILHHRHVSKCGGAEANAEAPHHHRSCSVEDISHSCQRHWTTLHVCNCARACWPMNSGFICAFIAIGLVRGGSNGAYTTFSGKNCYTGHGGIVSRPYIYSHTAPTVEHIAATAVSTKNC